MRHFNIDHCQIEIGNIETSSFDEILSTRYAKNKKVILVDENTHDACLEYLITAFPSLEDAEVMLLPAGEENKVLEVCFQVWEAFSDYQISRADVIINLGGGVVTDMGGFIASVFKRGLDFIHIPTSLLGMVDASIGGKTGIDLGPFKNQIGTFQHPAFIYIDYRFISTLPQEEVLNGFAEMLKHALIADAAHWNQLIKVNPYLLAENQSLQAFIEHSAQIKINIVQQDPTEKGIRKSLNFGHTIGHGIEGFCLETGEPIAHGHAVALGMIAESYLSFKKQFISEKELMQIVACITQGFDYVAFSLEAKTRITELMLNDKKNDHAGIKAVLLNGIGNVHLDVIVSQSEALDALTYIDSAFSGN